MLNTSYISRDEYNLMNEDGAFPLKKQRLGEQEYDAFSCDLQLGDCILKDITFFVVEEQIMGRIGLDILLTRFSSLTFNNEKRTISFLKQEPTDKTK